MAAPLFYNQGDQDIYNSGSKFVPQEKYRLGYTAPTTEEEKITETFGIPNTNAFTNSGSNSFNQSGNAFGYGSPVSEVNVRTFNPQSNDPTGSVANAQTMYNKANNAGPMVQTFTGMRPSESVMDYYGGQIMDNKEQYGAQGQYNSPYDDTVDQSKYTTTIGSFPSQGFFNRMRNKGFNLAENIPFIGLPTRILKSILPEQENRGPGGGNYGIGGLSDDQKDAYNKLAAAGGLFKGQNGFKTLTGKNFNLSDKQFDKYMSGQKDIYNQMTKDGYEIDDEGNVTFKGKPVDKRLNFQKLKYKESSALFKEKIAKQKALREAEQNRLAGLIGTRGTGAQGTSSIIQGEGGGNTPGTSRASDHGGVGLGHNAGNVRSANAAGTGSAQGYNQNLRSGGRAGYFFGGRAMFKNGGLASIL